MTHLRSILILALAAAVAEGCADEGHFIWDVPPDVRDAVTDDGGRCGPDGTCPDDQTCCPNGCKDLENDDVNCGECGFECDLDQICQRGYCRTPECMPECLSSQYCCRGECVYLAGDRNNCGGCGNVCHESLNCVGGICMCGSGTSAQACTGSQICCPSGCADLMSDSNNCGECGATCGGLACNLGQCVCGSTVCPVGWSCCEGECFDLSSDMNHCGSCIGRCDANRSTACVEGTCMCGVEEQCPSGTVTYPLCQLSAFMPPYRCCSGRCAAIDDSNCARCGQACSGSQECQASAGILSCQFSCGYPE
jgi:hypothetical protein